LLNAKVAKLRWFAAANGYVVNKILSLTFVGKNDL